MSDQSKSDLDKIYDPRTTEKRLYEWWESSGYFKPETLIEKGLADVGIVWTTEVVEAKAEGRKIDGVAIAAPYNKADKVGYAIGSLNSGRNQENAAAYLAYLATDDAQKIYESYGFVGAKAEELSLKPIP